MNRSWDDYKAGFGDRWTKNGEYWLGNDILNTLTQTGRYKLHFDLQSTNDVMIWAEYANFTVSGEDSLYQLHIGDYNGNAGDASMPGTDKALDGMKFSTVDRDNDHWEYNCALVVGGGFWYSNCGWMLVNSIVEKDK